MKENVCWDVRAHLGRWLDTTSFLIPAWFQFDGIFIYGDQREIEYADGRTEQQRSMEHEFLYTINRKAGEGSVVTDGREKECDRSLLSIQIGWLNEQIWFEGKRVGTKENVYFKNLFISKTLVTREKY